MRRQSFVAINHEANQLGAGLRALGVACGDRVGVWAHNVPELFPVWLGMEKHNIVRAVLHSHFGMAEHLQSLNHLDATAMLFDTRFTEQVAASRNMLNTVQHLVAIGENPPPWAVPYPEVIAAGSKDEPELEVDEDTPCFIQFTSGTTGRPKPWVVTHRAWQAVINHNLHHLDTFGRDIPAVGPWDVNLHFHALQWATGFQTLYPYLIRGARSVLLDDAEFDPAVVVDTLLTEGVTGVFAPAPLWAPILDEVERRGGIDHRLQRVVIFFGSAEILDRTTDLIGPVWAHGFGSTEQGAITTRLLSLDLDGHHERRHSVGRPGSPFFEVTIKDSDGTTLRPTQSGEVCVRSAMSSGWYWNLPDATRRSRFPGEWLRTGDVGYLDEDGYLYYGDRAKDALSTKAGVVYPHLVEAALARHPAVRNSGVVGIGEHGQQICAAVVELKPGNKPSADLAAEIRATASTSLAEHERPQVLKFVESLPTVLGGAKVQRSLVQKLITEER